MRHTNEHSNLGQNEVIGSVLLIVITILFVGSIGGYYMTQTQSAPETPYAEVDSETNLQPLDETFAEGEYDPENDEDFYTLEFTLNSFERGDYVLLQYNPQDQTKSNQYIYLSPGVESYEWSETRPDPPDQHSQVGQNARFPPTDQNQTLYNDINELDELRLETGDQFAVIAMSSDGTEQVVQTITYTHPDEL